ncbi:GMC family oxidoreductase N-terminal domain-containing protein [Pseudonocardia phyllosphaerae]|uniref:GMC family oxidoreductase N-terminal domain-containing protein n=1 Tax=Pseudonocardia phyllosphaerae TaxID=3390502 RepID=UPI003979577D
MAFSPTDGKPDYDVLVVGSGFGGSVTALRLTEKGYRVGVLEAGKRFDKATLPKTSWDVRNFLWAPRLGCYGIQRIHLLRDVVILAGAGVGGGSLNYANTLYRPPAAFYADRQWSGITDWSDELAPHYDQAERMLGVVENPRESSADRVIRSVAEDMGCGDTYHRTRVGVLFGEQGTRPGSTVPDPFFGGAGPDRTTCTACGSCMTGCRVGAKNTLDRNYLHLAESAGAEVRPLTTVTAIRPLPGGGYAVDTRTTGSSGRRERDRHTFTASQVVLSAGTYNTQRLLLSQKDNGNLPGLSSRLGVLTRTNSESILCAKTKASKGVDYTDGVAITSSFHPDAHTHIEPVRYGRGSNLMGMLLTALTDGGKPYPRFLTWLWTMISKPRNLGWLSVRRWSERSIIMLVMQTLDNSITVSGRRRFGRFRMTSGGGHGEPNPTWIPAANEATRRVADKIDGIAAGSIGEIANVPMTAHFIGGCAIGSSPETGVIDPYHRVYGHPGLHVADGSTISANLGVNPSLTITAQAERAMSFWPNAGETDARPPLGSAYERIDAVAPASPVVPDDAPGALHSPVALPTPAVRAPAS